MQTFYETLSWILYEKFDADSKLRDIDFFHLVIASYVCSIVQWYMIRQIDKNCLAFFIVCRTSELYDWHANTRERLTLSNRGAAANEKIIGNSDNDEFTCSNFRSILGKKEISMPCYNHVLIGQWLFARFWLEFITHACSLKKDVRRHKQIIVS